MWSLLFCFVWLPRDLLWDVRNAVRREQLESVYGSSFLSSFDLSSDGIEEGQLHSVSGDLYFISTRCYVWEHFEYQVAICGIYTARTCFLENKLFTTFVIGLVYIVSHVFLFIIWGLAPNMYHRSRRINIISKRWLFRVCFMWITNNF